MLTAALTLPEKRFVEVTLAAASGEPASGSTVAVVEDVLRLLLKRAGTVTLHQPLRYSSKGPCLCYARPCCSCA